MSSIVGIKVRVDRHASGDQGIAPLDIALQAAEETGLPLMAHIDEPPPSYEAVIERLRPGDVLTHAFRPFPNTPCTAQGAVKPAVRAARERGVLFDIGHGMGSFAFKTARAMLAGGFSPDTISSDLHTVCINGPAFDQVTTLSEIPVHGRAAFRRHRYVDGERGHGAEAPGAWHLKPGSPGDPSILSIEEGAHDYVDATGEHMTGDRRIFPKGVVLGGKWWHPV